MKNTFVPTSLAIGTALAIALSAPVSAAATSPSDVTSEIDWSGHIAAGSTLTIVNPRGAMYVQLSDDGSASLRGIVTQPNSASDGKTTVVATASGNGITLCTTLADASTTCAASRDASSERAAAAASQYRVDELVLVPRGVRVVARGIEGNIVVEDAPSSVDASTLDGDIHVSAAGGIAAMTGNGSIYASLAKPAGADASPMVFRSKNGSISIDAPRDANFIIKASAPNGKISAAVPVVASLADARGAVIDAEADSGSIVVTTHS